MSSYRTVRSVVTAAFLLTAAFALSPSVTGAALEDKRQHVLVLYGLQSYMPIVMDWDEGIRRAIKSKMEQPVRIDTEFLDLLRSNDNDYRDRWLDLLERKYKDNQPDIVIAVFDPGLRFILDYRDRLFPGVPVVFCSANDSTAANLKLPQDVTGVTYQFGYEDTIRLATSLRPATKQVFVVVGSSDYGKLMMDEARNAFDGFQDLDFNYLTDLTVPELEKAVEDLPEDSLVLFLVYVRDPGGRQYYANDVLAKITRASRVPVFSLFDTNLGFGTVGGHMIRINHQGELAGEIAVKVLRGQGPSSIALTGSETNRSVVDWREFNRWSLLENQLPPDTVIINRDQTIWQKHGQIILGASVIILLQAGLIMGLLVNRNRRRKAESSLRKSREEARALAGQIITAQEDERGRLAREMHDDISQRLAAAANEAGKLESEFDSAGTSSNKLSSIRNELVSLADDAHTISRRLHPSILDDLGLEDAIRSECQSDELHNDVTIDFKSRDVPPVLPREISICAYRVTQEAIRNAIKHSATSHIEVKVMADDEFLYLSIKDDGKGFETRSTLAKSGVGLASMQERVRLVGGKIAVHSEPDKGTTIEATIPLVEN